MAHKDESRPSEVASTSGIRADRSALTPSEQHVADLEVDPNFTYVQPESGEVSITFVGREVAEALAGRADDAGAGSGE